MASSGYAAVWATANTRKALFDAMKRKQVYATAGPRMLVRFWGGWDFVEADAQSRLPAAVGYAKGIPMGGDLTKGSEGKSPTFWVAALKDPYGASLDRIQIVKGWLDKKGKTHEKVYNCDWLAQGRADGRRLAESRGRQKSARSHGRCPERSVVRQPRSHSDYQRLGGSKWQAPRADL
jgi:hypothetical protein